MTITKYIELLKLAIKNVKRRKLRSFLTILGVIIGVASIVLFISLGESIEQSITQSFESIGKNKLIIFPGVKSKGSLSSIFYGTGFDFRLADDLSRLPDVKKAIPMVFTSAQVKFKKEVTGLNIYGFPLEDRQYLGELGYKLLEGNYPKSSKDCLIGYAVHNGAFSEEVNIGDKLVIANKFKCRVVGILQSMGSQHEDYSILVSLDVMRKYFNKTRADLIVVLAKNVEKAKDEISKYLERKLGRKTFTILTMGQLINQFKSLLGVVSVIIAAIAGISLITAAIGIMNTMYMAVTERVEEIGIMKAIGAKYRDILLIFLIEAGFIGLIGGIIGDILALLTLFAITNFASFFGRRLVLVLDWRIILLSLVFSFIIGIIAGLLPSRAAAKTDPIKALRRL